MSSASKSTLPLKRCPSPSPPAEIPPGLPPPTVPATTTAAATISAAAPPTSTAAAPPITSPIPIPMSTPSLSLVTPTPSPIVAASSTPPSSPSDRTGTDAAPPALTSILTPPYVASSEIDSATNPFDKALLLSVGGFRKVYKGDTYGGSMKFTIERGNTMSDRIQPDTYSFGVVLFEVLCVRPALSPTLPKEQEWADELTANYEHKLFESMLERNGQKIFGNVLFVFDPGETFTVEKRGSFFVTMGNGEKLQCQGACRKIIGYGWAVMLRRYFVDLVEMWWHAKLSQVSLFTALHEMDLNSKGPSRIKFFLIFFTLDFAGISTYHGSPFIATWFFIVNIAAGFIMFIYIIAPCCYWIFNTFNARKFPMFSNKLLTIKGLPCDATKDLTPRFELNEVVCNSYGKFYLSPLFAWSIGSGFVRFTTTLTHVFLFHGSDIWSQSKSAVSSTIST